MKTFMKTFRRALAFGLAVVFTALSCSSAPGTVSDGPVETCSEAESLPAMISSGRAKTSTTVADQDPDRYVTQSELPALFAIGPGGASPDPDSGYVTLGQFLYHLSKTHGDRYFAWGGDGSISYPAGGTLFLSQADWADASARLGENVTLGEARDWISRADGCDLYFKLKTWPKTRDEYETIIRDYYPEFAGLMDACPDAVAYWLDSGSFTTERFYFQEFSSVMHELTHEYSARQSGCFMSRAKQDDGWWQVRWSRQPSTMWFVDPSDMAWESHYIAGLPSAYGMAVPYEYTQGELWTQYSDGIYAQGLPCILQELMATEVELKMAVISMSLGHMYYYLPEHILENYVFWTAMLDCYMQSFGGYVPADLVDYAARLSSTGQALLNTYPDRVVHR